MNTLNQIYQKAYSIRYRVWSYYPFADIYYLLHQAIRELRLYQSKKVRYKTMVNGKVKVRYRVQSNSLVYDPYDLTNLSTFYSDVWNQILERNKFTTEKAMAKLKSSNANMKFMHIVNRDGTIDKEAISTILKNAINETL